MRVGGINNKDNANDNSDDNSKGDNEESAIPCPRSIQLVFPADSKSKLSLKAQKPRVRDVVGTAMDFLPVYLTTINAFPDRKEMVQDLRELLIKSARKHGDDEIKQQLRLDHKYAKQLMRLVCFQFFLYANTHILCRWLSAHQSIDLRLRLRLLKLHLVPLACLKGASLL